MKKPSLKGLTKALARPSKKEGTSPALVEQTSLEPDLGTHNPVLLINNSFCSIHNFPEKAVQAIRAGLTYDNHEAIMEKKNVQVQLSYAYRYKNRQKIEFFKKRLKQLDGEMTICWLRKNTFPTGHLDLVKDLLSSSWGGVYEIRDLRQIPDKKAGIKTQKEPFPLRYYQKAMADLAEKYHRGVFSACVGSGKTRLMQEIILRLNVPTLIILPSKDLQVQTYDSFVELFGDKAVECITAAKVKPTSKFKAIRLVTVQSLASLMKKDNLSTLLKDVEMVCTDEAHHAGSKTYTSLLPYFEHVYYRFAFTGTWTRNDSKTLDMWGFISGVLYEYPASQATKEGYLTPLKVIVHELPGEYNRKYQAEYKANYCNDGELCRKIREVLENQIGLKDQVLILVGRKETAGAVIHAYLKTYGIEATYISGDDKKDVVKKALADFNSKKIQILIGSTIIGEGIDVRSTDHLIMALGGKSEIQITQATGRAVRLYEGKKVAYIHDFRFANTRYMEAHLEKRLKIYSKNFAAELVGSISSSSNFDNDSSFDDEDFSGEED